MARGGIAAVLLGICGGSAAMAQDVDWKAEHDAGWEDYKAGKLDDAERHLRAAVEAARTLGEGDPRLAQALDHLAWVLASGGRVGEAIPLARSAVAIREAKPEEAAALADCLNTLACLQDLRGDTEAARAIHERCLAVAEKALGPDGPGLAPILDNLATDEHLLGHLDRAEALYGRALAIREKDAGGEAIDLAATLHNLGALAIDQGRFDRAGDLLRRALEIREKALGAGHPDVATNLEALGRLYALQGRPEEAMPLLTKALALYEHDLGAGHPDVARCCLQLADCCGRRGDTEGAVEFGRRAVATYERAGAGPSELAPALDEYAAALRKAGRASEAGPIEERARGLRESAARPGSGPG
jgi:tetratricopeptide (TPR) repeat protein